MDEIEPKRTHYTQTEIEVIQGLIYEGDSTREIATKMNRTISGIKNLKRRLKLTHKTINETQNEISSLQKMRDILEEKIIDQRITLAILEPQIHAREAKLKDLKTQVQTLEEEQANLKPLVDYYRNHREEALQELRALMQNEADLITIQKIFQWLEV